ncbi:hypothetical protein GT021_02260, partial [Streptomyces sp. SID5470]|nr:hypothetical protein [Streptomyces sp. SID5470]
SHPCRLRCPDFSDRFDVVIGTVSAPHHLVPYLRLVAMDGTPSHLGHLGFVTVRLRIRR